MKKFLAVFAMLTILLTSSIASAAYEENIEEGVDLTTVKRIAVAMPNFYRTAEAEPTIEELTKLLYTAGRDTSAHNVVSYEEVAAAIRRDTGVDIYSLAPVEAEKIFKANVAKYADSYLIVTVANHSEKPWFFFCLYNSADQNLIYTFSLQSRSISKNTKDYNKAAESFYKKFDVTSAENLSKEDKKAQEKIREAKENKRKDKDMTYKTGRSKVDLVKKK